MKKLWTAIAAVMVAVGVTACSAGDDASEAGAQVVCEQAVERQVGTVDFADPGDQVVSLKDDRAAVSAWFDADGERVVYLCVAEYRGDDEWRLLDLDVG